MPAPPYTPLPPAPNRKVPATFADLADAFVAAQPTFGDQLNALAVYAGNAADAAAASEAVATDAKNTAVASASTAVAAAQSAVNAPGTSATSTTSLAIGTGAKTLTIQTGKNFALGQPVMIASTANPGAAWMAGNITAHNQGTGALTVNVVRAAGSGTFAAWTISLAGPAFTDVVSLSGNETVGGVKTFANPIGGSVTGTASGVARRDARAVDDPPSDLVGQLRLEFKTATVVGSPPVVSSAPLYAHILSVSAYQDGSGGWPTQISIGPAGIALRTGVSASAWDAWRTFVDAHSNQIIGGNKTLTGITFFSGPVSGKITAVGGLSVNCATGNYFTETVSANRTFTFINAPAGSAYSFTLELTHTAGTVTWPASVKWPHNAAPSLTPGKTHLFMFVTDDGGTRWRGAALPNYDN